MEKRLFVCIIGLFLVLGLVSFVLAASTGKATYEVKRGDVNQDGVIDAADLAYMMDYSYYGGPYPNPKELGDVNGDGLNGLADITYFIQYYYSDGPAPVPLGQEVQAGTVVECKYDSDCAKDGVSYCSGGQCVASCEDGDKGIVPGVKSTVYFGNNQYSDSCTMIDGGVEVLNEYYCDSGGFAKAKAIVCDDGCSDGTCVGSAECLQDVDCYSGEVCEGGQCRSYQNMESFKFQKTSTHLLLGMGIKDVVGTSLTDDYFPNFLKSGYFVANDGFEYSYDQEINPANLSVTYFEDSDYKEDVWVYGVRVASDSPVLTYTLDFNDEPSWAGLQGSNLYFLGKTYYVFSASVGSKITLMEYGGKGSVKESSSRTFTVNGKNYEASINFVDSDEVVLEINGDLTNSLREGESYKLADGTYVGIDDISYSSQEGVSSFVAFSLGTGKIELVHNSNVNAKGDMINGLLTYFINDGDKLSRIEVKWIPDDDVFATEEQNLEMPYFNVLRFRFSGLSDFYGEKEANLYLDAFYKDEVSINQRCSDSDSGKDYYNRGEVIISSSNGASMIEDTCISASSDGTGTLREYFCSSDNTFGSVDYFCSNGCKDGACVKEVPDNEICQDVIAKVANPKDFNLNNFIYHYSEGSFDLYHGNYYVGGDLKPYSEYSSLWSAYDDYSYSSLRESVLVFDDPSVDASWMVEDFKDKPFCSLKYFYNMDASKEDYYYVCNYDILFGQSDSNRIQRYIFWSNKNVLVTISSYTYQGYDGTGQDVPEEDVIKLINGIKDNVGEFYDYSDFSLPYFVEAFAYQDVTSCGTEIPEPSCSPCWNCKDEPLICPPHGSITKTCIDSCCGSPDYSVGRTCSPGVCSGCYVPRWIFNWNSDNICIPYGFRFAQDTGDFVSELVEGKGGSEVIPESSTSDDYNLVIESSEKAILTIYNVKGEAVDLVLTPGARIELAGILFDADEYYVSFILVVDKINYDSSGEGSVEISTEYTYYQNTPLKIDAYCDIDGNVKIQKSQIPGGDWAKCQNNFECASNICSNGECIEVRAITQDINVFKRFFAQVGCRIMHPFSGEEYDSCVYGILGPTTEVPSSGSSSSGGSGSASG